MVNITNIKIGYRDIGLNFDDYSIVINGIRYKGGDIEVKKETYIHRTRYRNGSVGCSVRVARGVYVNRREPCYKEESKQVTNIIITNVRTGHRETISFIVENLDLALLLGWSKKKTYKEVVEEFDKKEKEKQEEMKANSIVVAIPYIISFIVMLTGHFFIALLMFVPSLLISFTLVEIVRKGMTLDNKRALLAWFITLIMYVISVINMEDLFIPLFLSVVFFVIGSIIAEIIIKK